MNNDRMIKPLNCCGCGASLPEAMVCEYCGTKHGYVERYTGPQVDDEIWPMKGDISVMNYQTFYVTAAGYPW